VQRRGRSHGRGIPDVALWPISRSTPVRRQRTAPDETSELRFKPAYQSLITDVFRLRLHRCTIITAVSPAKIAWRRYLALKLLDEGHQSDIRVLVRVIPALASLMRATRRVRCRLICPPRKHCFPRAHATHWHDGQISKNLSSPNAKNIPLSPSGKSALPARAIPCPSRRGVSRSSRTLGAGCGGRFQCRRDQIVRTNALKRTAKSCGPDAPTLVSSFAGS
jgi:hypothetical protein